jgi:hypothetical protein
MRGKRHLALAIAWVLGASRRPQRIERLPSAVQEARPLVRWQSYLPTRARNQRVIQPRETLLVSFQFNDSKTHGREISATVKPVDENLTRVFRLPDRFSFKCAVLSELMLLYLGGLRN